MSNEFKNEVFSSYAPNPIKACNYCGRQPVLLRSMLNSQTGAPSECSSAGAVSRPG